jgi:subtilisin family serine protease
MLIVSVLMIPLSLFAADGSKLDVHARMALAQMRSGAAPRDLMQMGAGVNENGELDVFIRGTVSRSELEAAGAVVRTEIPGIVFTAFIPAAAVSAVEALPGVERISGAVMCEEYLNTSVPTTRANLQRAVGPGFAGANGAGVLIGDIDTGISYAHGDFKDAAGNTRIVRIWDQTTPIGPAPAGYTVGTEYLPAAINAGTAQGKDTDGHGTHVMGIAAGDGSLTGGAIPAYTYVGMAPMASIVMIKTDFYETSILDGAKYFFGLATALGQPAVLNISLGSQYGPHDGTSDLSVGLDALTGPGRAICVAAGNDGGTTSPLSHRHAKVVYGPIYPAAVSAVLTLSGTGVGRYVLVDGVYDAADAVSITISHPIYGSFGPYGLGVSNDPVDFIGVPFGSGATRGNLYVENGLTTFAGDNPEIFVAIQAGSTTGSTFNGNWTLTFTPTAPAGPQNGRIDLWQYKVSHTAIVANFSAGIDDACLLGGNIATANNVITCGAWITKNSWTNCAGLGITAGATNPPSTVNLIAYFSSNGPTRDGRMKPEIAAPGELIGSALTRDVSFGTCTTSSTYYSFLNDNMMHWIQQGTSMSAPHVTGAVALLFQKFGPLTRAEIMSKLTTLALVDGNTGAVPNNRWGVGKLRVDVTDPTATVIYPNSAVTLNIGTSVDLLWTASDPIWSGVASVDLELSRDNGANWSTLVSGVSNTGLFTWTPTAPVTTQALLRVSAHDMVDNIGRDVSDAVFSIQEPAVAVEMSLFKADNTDNGVRVRWTFVEAAYYASSWVERANSGTSSWIRVDAPVVASAEGFSVTDATAQFGTAYVYRVAATTVSGETVAFEPVAITAANTITEFALGQVWPNPTKNSSTVSFSVPRSAHVGVKVIDVRGRLVTTLVDANYAPGRYQASWNGRGRDGATAPNGVYFVHLVTPDKRLVQRVTLVR